MDNDMAAIVGYGADIAHLDVVTWCNQMQGYSDALGKLPKAFEALKQADSDIENALCTCLNQLQAIIEDVAKCTHCGRPTNQHGCTSVDCPSWGRI